MLNPVSNGSCSGFLIASTINNVLNFVVNIQVFQSKGTICNHVRWMDMDVNIGMDVDYNPSAIHTYSHI
jgi:hypothetical protein